MSALLWNPTLAATLSADADLRTLPYPLFASPKLDGVRATVQHGVLVSRTGRSIANATAQLMFGSGLFEGLDGELTVGKPSGPDVFNRTVRVTQKRDASARDLRFNVFDAFCNLSSFKERQAYLKDHFAKDMSIVRQTRITGPDQLALYEEKALADGYEGVMLRRCDAGPYMQKRSTLREFNLVKLKRFEHAFATTLRVHPLRHNDNEEKTGTGKRSSKKAGIRLDKTLVGSVDLVDDKTGVEFSVNVLTDVLRAWPGWKDFAKWRGLHVRYKYQPVGTLKGGAPRFPVCTFDELEMR